VGLEPGELFQADDLPEAAAGVLIE